MSCLTLPTGAVAALALLVLGAAPACAQQPAQPTQPAQLAAPEARITDGVIQRDHGTYAAMQGRLKAINDGGRPVRDYALSKAQCWLDVSFHEYTRNDRSAFPQAALGESEKLAVAMEAKQSPIPTATELVNGAARLRPDLWAQIDAMKARPGFRCAQQQAACAEVELAHAGHEYNQQQWRHAKPYIQIAEDLIAEGTALAERCEVPPAVVAAATPNVPAPNVRTPNVPTPVLRSERLVASAVFRFDRSGMRDILPASVSQIDAMVAQLKAGDLVVRSIRLVGYADRLNGTRDAAYNQKLSERRSATVRALLIARGIAASAIEAAARGDTVQIESCTGKFASRAALEACLLPNRRVEIQIEATRGAR